MDITTLGKMVEQFGWTGMITLVTILCALIGLRWYKECVDADRKQRIAENAGFMASIKSFSETVLQINETNAKAFMALKQELFEHSARATLAQELLLSKFAQVQLDHRDIISKLDTTIDKVKEFNQILQTRL